MSLFFLFPLNQSEACKECVLNANDMVDDMEALEKTSQAFLYFKANFPEQIEALHAFVSCKKMCLFILST